MSAKPRIGIDLGGTKIEGILLAPNGDILTRARVPTPAGDAVATIQAIRDLVDKLEEHLAAVVHRPLPVGIGTPGSLSPATGLLRNSNSTCLNGLQLDQLIAEALQRPVRIANDANCFALSEASDGAGSDAGSVFGVILGTGVGGGLVIDGQIIGGHLGIAGEWGHNPLPWPLDDERPGPTCYCGLPGCIETFLSGPGLRDDHKRRSGMDISPQEISVRAAAGEARSTETLARYTDRLARALATIINIVDPEIIVLGGGLSNLPQIYRDVPQLWGRWVFSDIVTTRLVPPHHGDSSGVRGAAWLWSPDEA